MPLLFTTAQGFVAAVSDWLNDDKFVITPGSSSTVMPEGMGKRRKYGHLATLKQYKQYF